MSAVRLTSSLGLLGLSCLLFAGVAGCKDEDSLAGVGRPVITVAPTEVVFPEVPIGSADSQSVLIENRGSGTLRVSDFDWSGRSQEFSVRGLDDIVLEAGDSTTFVIEYLPEDPGTDSATLTLFSNSVEDSELEIEVRSQGQAARLLADPASVDLLAEQPGLLVSQVVRLQNIGSDTMVLETMELVADTGDFSLILPQLPVEVPPNEAVEITVEYVPSSPGTDSDQLAIACNAINCTEGFFFLPINGVTEAPRLRLTPGDVTFGAVAQNPSPAPVELLTALNDGSGVLEITSIAWLPNGADTNREFEIVSIDGEAWDPARTEPWLLAAGESMNIEISYTPTDSQSDLELLEFVSNDAGLPRQQVRVAGRLSAPQLEVSPPLLEMPLTARNRTSTRQITIRNAGAEPLDLAYIEPRGGGFDSGVLSLTNAAAAPDFLAPGEEFLLEVRFAPVVADLTFAGTVYVGADNVPDPAGQERRVDITAISTTDPVCQVRVLPGTLDFGTVPRGTLRELTGRIRNSGSGACRLNSAVKQASFFGVLFSDSFEIVRVLGPDGVSSPPFTIEAGEEATITASYFPRTLTDLSESPFGDTASIELRMQDVENPGTTVTCGVAPPFFGGGTRACGINLQARSAVASIGVIPTDIDFGRVTLGCNSQTQTVRVYNTGGADVDISSIRLEDCSAEFALAGVPALPTVIGRGASVPFQVRYRPADEGVDECRIVVESTAEGGRYVVPLRGEGVTYSRTVDRFEQVSGREVDVLFVVDNSGSMSEEQSNLTRNFSSFMTAARTWGSDFQLGVVTTQTDGDVPNPSGGDRGPGELLGNPRIVTPRTPSFETAFTRNASVGTSDSTASSTERGLEAAYLALTDPNITDFAGSTCTADADCGGAPYLCIDGADSAPRACGGFNRTFLRETASLEIVFLSDEEDSSRAELNFYIDFFRSIKGFRNTSLFHASAIVGPSGGCTSSAGDAVAGNRYIDVARATNGEVGSICDSNFSSILSEIGNRAFGLRVDFYLSRAADTSTVRVYTLSDCGPSPTRTEVTTGWTYDAASNSVLWTESAAPRPGQCFEVDYEAACF